MIHIIWGSDYHLGLKTDDIDREEEIFGIFEQQTAHASNLVSEGQQVIFIMGGDIFNRNNPSEDLISRFIERVINPLKKLGIDVYVIVGNHDSISVPGNTSCLNFIDKIRTGYPNIRLVSDISVKKITVTDFGPLWFSFLPHITRAHLEGTDFKNTQAYIDSRAEKIIRKIGPDGVHYAFSHLNVKGAHPGSEENLLKKSEVYIPKCFLEKSDTGYKLPEIIQGHIHTHDVIGNINIVGSPLYCGFGEGEIDKFYLHIEVATSMGEKDKFNYIPTICRKFLQVELDLSKDWDGVDFLGHHDVQKFLVGVVPNSVVKFDLKVNPKNCSVDWASVRAYVMENWQCYVKPIMPKYVYERVVRSEKQTIKLQPSDAVKVWLKSNKPPRAKEKYKLAQNYLQE